MRNIFKSAVETFGSDIQLIMLIEEMSELTQAISKYFRGEENAENIAEEIADVHIMLEQALVIFNNGKLVSDYLDSKLNRLSELIEKHQQEDKKQKPE